jgi:hypothetical protein
MVYLNHKMMKQILFLIAMVVGNSVNAQTVHSFKVENIDGKVIDLATFKGKKIMIVNTKIRDTFKEIAAEHIKYINTPDEERKYFKRLLTIFKEKLTEEIKGIIRKRRTNMNRKDMRGTRRKRH